MAASLFPSIQPYVMEKINEKDYGEEDPARGGMESRDDFREAVISEHNKRSDSDGVAEKHGQKAGAASAQSSALPKAIPIEKRHNTKR